MEDEKLAAYYDELTRKGGGAARFKQGLGFSSSTDDAVPARGSSLPAPSASSFLSSFVRASSPAKTNQFEKQAQLQSIQNKLAKKPQPKILNSSRSPSPSRKVRNSRSRSRSRSRDRYSRRRRSRSGSRDRYSRRRRSRSGSRDRYSRKHRSKSRSRSRDSYSRRRRRSRSRERRSRSNRRSSSRSEETRSRNEEKDRDRRKRDVLSEERRTDKGKKQNGGGIGIDYSKLIEGYDHMTPAERVKAKMKLQLSRTAENDETIAKGSGWERFDFDKDAPLDDEEIEAAEDDTKLVKHIGQSFRFAAVEARREEQIKAAHDEAMFGASSHPPAIETDDEAEGESFEKQNTESAATVTNLFSDQVISMQQGSWRDRARKT